MSRASARKKSSKIVYIHIKFDTFSVTFSVSLTQRISNFPQKKVTVSYVNHGLTQESAYYSIPIVISYNFTCMRNHVKLDIRSFVMNFKSAGFSLRVLYCVVDTGYGLSRSLGDCRPALPKGRKYQMVKTQTESHNRRPIV